MASAVGEIRLRPITAADEPFLRALYGSTRAEELAPVPWSEEQKRAFLDMQFHAQTIHYQKHYGDGEFLMIENRGEPIGRLLLHRTSTEIRIIDISLLPEHRRRGIGTNLLRDVLDEGAASSRRVSIHVEHFNPAKRLYERLGFRHVETNGVYDLMVK
jgi:ribosomal protein S18 acetylase RimI-like enzyme